MASSLLISNSLSSSVVLPRGYVFAPTDSELFCHFLHSKIQNPDVKFKEIHDLDDIYKYTPEILASLYEKKRAKEWYFFSPRIMKHENGSRPNRKVAGQSSFWRASNGGKMMVRVHNRQFLGHKGALNYFKNKQSKTNWIMQEYTLASQNHHGSHKFKDYSLCKIYQRIGKASRNKSSTVISHQSDVGDEGGLEDYIMPQLPYYEDVNHGVAQQAGIDMAPTMNNITNAYDHQYINIEDGADTINCEEAMPPLMIINQDHPSVVPFIATDDNDCGNSSNFGLSNIEPHHADPEEAGAIIQDYQEKYQCDFNTDHPDVVAPPNVESTRGFRGRGPRLVA
ncbi:hypothetical protein Syun_015045 [Stephania yunnanensis]|uniref:NAC domain-containing protein n=1 Tax=Stephania yunnanensis TaxID=152371 RepID=A0AAP0PCG9_9MAGN